LHGEGTPISFEARPGGAEVVIATVLGTGTQLKPVCAVDVVVRYTVALSGLDQEVPQS
jgi:hypothetical protein